MSLHYGKDDFADQSRLVRALSRDRAKDMASDYAREPLIVLRREFAERRGITAPFEIVAPERRNPFAGLKLRINTPQPTPKRSMFDGLKLSVSTPAIPAIDSSQELGVAVRRYAVAFAEVDDAERVGRTPLPHLRTALDKATERLDRAQASGARDLRIALLRNPAFIDEVKQGRTMNAIQAMTLERELRADPVRRADRFVDDWRTLNHRRVAFDQADKLNAASRVTQQMATMAKSLERDPQVESILRNRIRELGIERSGGKSMSQDLQRWLGLSRSRGLGL